MDKKVKLILIFSTGLFLFLVLIGIGYNIWSKYQFGTLKIISDSEVIFYDIKETGNTYAGNQTIPKLKKGFYNIHAYGILEDLYYPKDYQIEVKGNKASDLEIKLEKTPTNADISGVEGP